jgi:hypothetical protein
MNLPLLKRRIRRHAEVCVAAWRSFRYRTYIGAPWFAEGLSLLKQFIPFRRPRVKSKFSTMRFRIRACRACDLYDSTHRTCGNNAGGLVANINGVETFFPNGCGCKVGVKASYPEEDCTLKSFGIPSNWNRLGFFVDGGEKKPEAAPSNVGRPNTQSQV